MYNRYIPEDVSYTPVEEKQAPSRGRQGPPERSKPLFHLSDLLVGKEGASALGSVFSGEGRGLSSLFKALHLENIDSGDVLLLLIMLYLLVEGDDLELVIALGLVLIMGLGDRE